MKDIFLVFLYGALCLRVGVAIKAYTSLTDTTQTDTTTYTTQTESQANTTQTYIWEYITWTDTSQADKTQTDTTGVHTTREYTTQTDTTQTDTTTYTTQASTTHVYTTKSDTSPTDITQTSTTQADTTRSYISQTSRPADEARTITTWTGKTMKDTTKTGYMRPTNGITTETQNTTDEPPGTTKSDKWYNSSSAIIIFSIVGAVLLAILVCTCVWFLCRKDNKWRKMSIMGAGQRIGRWSHRLTQTFDANHRNSEDSGDEETSHPNQITMSSFTKNGINNGVANEDTKDEESGGLDNTVCTVGVDASSLDQPSSVTIDEVNEKDEKTRKSDDVTTVAAESKDVIVTDEKPSGGDLLDSETSKVIEGDVADERVNNSSLQKNDDDNATITDGEKKSEEAASSE